MRLMTSAAPFQYDDGSPILPGDHVVVCDTKDATVDRVLKPLTPEARSYGCQDTGGILLAITGGGLELWTRVDEPLDLVSRAREPQSPR